LAALVGEAPVAAPAPPDPVAGAADTNGEWEAACFREGCRAARRLAVGRLAALEAWLHAQRPAGYVVTGWRERTVVARFGDVRVRRRRYQASDGTTHYLLDEHLAWEARQVLAPTLAALLVEWAATVPFRTAAKWLEAATAGVVSGPTAWRAVQRVAVRVVATERAVHGAWATTGVLPQPEGRRVVGVLYAEADGVWVKTQREPTHRHGCELKCASTYEGWDPLAGPTPGHPRPHFRLRAKRVYCHAFDHTGPQALPFWDGVSLALSRTYDLGQVPLVAVGGDGATWIDGATDVFHRVVRQRDGFHLARDAARGWGQTAGAQLYEAIRTGDPLATQAMLALPPPQTPRGAAAVPPVGRPALPPPAADPALRTAATALVPAGAPASEEGQRRPPTWSPKQLARARAELHAQVGRADAATDWRRQVAPEEVPADARALGTMEGTNAHLLARRMKRRGMAWTVRGARALAKVRELVTNGALAAWCARPAGPTPFAPGRPLHPGGFAPSSPLPWPQATCPSAHGPRRDPVVAHLQHLTAAALHRRS
jgi:hypothetical protein